VGQPPHQQHQPAFRDGLPGIQLKQLDLPPLQADGTIKEDTGLWLGFPSAPRWTGLLQLADQTTRSLR
jgi:hypothetical protein